MLREEDYGISPRIIPHGRRFASPEFLKLPDTADPVYSVMCNTYRITPKRGADKGVRAKVADAAGKLPGSLIRKTNPGVVVLADERVEIMRWGFWRPFNPSINNTRSDKLAAGMWAKAWHERRCIIPVSLFYEWGPGAGGPKQAHEFRDPEDDYLWIGGLWEQSAEFGPCYSMITTDAGPAMASIHKRMPAILAPDATLGFLGGGHWDLMPYAGPLVVAPCVSPLVKQRDAGIQRDLL